MERRTSIRRMGAAEGDEVARQPVTGDGLARPDAERSAREAADLG